MQSFDAEQFVFLYRPLKEAVSEEVWSKTFTTSIGPYKELSATPETVTIDNDRIINIVSLDRVTLAPSDRIHVTDSIAPQLPSPDDTTPQVETSHPTKAEGDHSRQRKYE